MLMPAAAVNRTAIHSWSSGGRNCHGTVLLPDGWSVTFSPTVTSDLRERRQALAGSQLYCFAGPLADAPNDIAAYAGMSSTLRSLRAADSYQHWVEAQQALRDPRAAIVNRDRPTHPDLLRFVEARVIQSLGSGPGLIAMLNTHSSAQTCAARLNRKQVLAGQDLAEDLADLLWDRLLDWHVNEWPAPASNTREQSIRIIRRAGRALDTDEIVQALRAIGHPSRGLTLDRSVRRDLLEREPSRGRPRILSTWHLRRRRQIYWTPDVVTRSNAIMGYERAHPPKATQAVTAQTRPLLPRTLVTSAAPTSWPWSL